MVRIRWGMVKGGPKKAEREKAERNEDRVRRRFWPALRANLHRIPFAEDAVAAYYSLIDPATPARTKAILAGALAYFIMPVDVIPDALVVLGFTDDAAVLMTALKAVSGSLMPVHYDRARAALKKPADDPADGAGEAQPSP